MHLQPRNIQALGLEAPHTVGARRLGWVTGGRSVDPAPLVQDLLEGDSCVGGCQNGR